MAKTTDRREVAKKAAKTRASRQKSARGARRTTKGALVRGMTKQLPSGILANPIFRSKLQELMKGYAGIYALYHHGQPYYVGLTTNLFGRVNGHLRDRHKDQWDHFVIFRIKKVNYLKDIETLITHLMPWPGNRVKGNVPRDGDINRILRQILTQHSREVSDIKKVLRK